MDRAAGFLLIILGDMALFGVFFVAAIIYRRNPEIHKRLPSFWPQSRSSSRPWAG